MGAALEQVRFTPDRYWHDLRIAVPKTTEPPALRSACRRRADGHRRLVADPRPAHARRGVSRARRRRRRVDLGDLGSRRLRAAAAWPAWLAGPRPAARAADRLCDGRARPAPSSRSCLATASTSRRRRALKRSSSASIRRIAPAAPAPAAPPEPRQRREARAEARNQARASAPSRPARGPAFVVGADRVRSRAPTFADLRPKPEPIAAPPAPKPRRRRSRSAHVSFELRIRSAEPAARRKKIARRSPSRPRRIDRRCPKKLVLAAVAAVAVLGGGYWAFSSFLHACGNESRPRRRQARWYDEQSGRRRRVRRRRAEGHDAA